MQRVNEIFELGKNTKQNDENHTNSRSLSCWISNKLFLAGETVSNCSNPILNNDDPSMFSHHSLEIIFHGDSLTLKGL